MVKTAAPAIDKAVLILDYLAESHIGRTFSQIQKDLSLPKSSTFNLLNSLLAHGLIRLQGDCYFLSLKLTRWGERAEASFALKDIAHPILVELSKQTGLTTHLGVMINDYPTYLIKIQSSYSVIVNSYVGKRLPLNSTALGKIFLAFLPSYVSEKLIMDSQPFAPYTANTITSLSELKAVVEKVHEEGFAIDNEEDCEGVVCLAAPVLNKSGSIVAAISISGVLSQYKQKPIEEQLVPLKAAAQELSAKINS